MDSLILICEGESEFVVKPASHSVRRLPDLRSIFSEAIDCAIDVFRLQADRVNIGLFIEVGGRRRVHVGERGYQALPNEKEVHVVVQEAQQSAAPRPLRRNSRSRSSSLNRSNSSSASLSTVFDRVQFKPNQPSEPPATAIEAPHPRRRPSSSQLLSYYESPDTSDSSMQLTAPSPPLTPPSSASSNCSSSAPPQLSQGKIRRRSVRFGEATVLSNQSQQNNNNKPSETLATQNRYYPTTSHSSPRRWPSVDGLVLHPPLLPSPPVQVVYDEPRPRKRSSSFSDKPQDAYSSTESTRSLAGSKRSSRKEHSERALSVSPTNLQISRPDSPMPISRT